MKTRKNPKFSLKTKYPLVLRTSLVVSLILLIGLMLLFPKFEQKQTTVTQKKVYIEQEEVPITQQQIEQAAPPSKPAIPVEADEDDLAEDIDFEMSSFEDYAPDWENPPPPPEEDDEDGGRQVRFIPFDEPPEPLGGFEAIQRNVIYPEIAQEAGIEGTVVVQAYVDEFGKVRDCNILKGIPNTGLNEAAINAIKKTDFKPAKQRDRNVGVWISIPVIFKLKD